MTSYFPKLLKLRKLRKLQLNRASTGALISSTCNGLSIISICSQLHWAGYDQLANDLCKFTVESIRMFNSNPAVLPDNTPVPLTWLDMEYVGDGRYSPLFTATTCERILQTTADDFAMLLVRLVDRDAPRFADGECRRLYFFYPRLTLLRCLLSRIRPQTAYPLAPILCARARLQSHVYDTSQKRLCLDRAVVLWLLHQRRVERN